MKKRGTGNAQIAIFLYNRVVKPFLLPMMIAYFGWVYVGILTVLTVLASITLGCAVSVLIKEKDKPGSVI